MPNRALMPKMRPTRGQGYFDAGDLAALSQAPARPSRVSLGASVITDDNIADVSITHLIEGDLSVTGTIIAGGSFQTGASGSTRVVIDNTGIYGYNASDVAQFYWLAADGKGYAAAGRIIFDSNGITVNNDDGSHTQLFTIQQAGVATAWIYSDSTTSRFWVQPTGTAYRSVVCEVYDADHNAYAILAGSVNPTTGSHDASITASNGPTGTSDHALVSVARSTTVSDVLLKAWQVTGSQESAIRIRSGAAGSEVRITGGPLIQLFSDAGLGSTEKGSWSAATGNLQTDGTLSVDGAATLNSTLAVGGDVTITADGLAVNPAGSVFAVCDFYAYNDTVGNVPRIRFLRARGSKTTPTAVLSGDALGDMTALGYGATGWSSARRVGIRFNAAEDWTDTAQGTHIQFLVTPVGGTSTAERMRVDETGVIVTGDVAINGADLDVQPATTGQAQGDFYAYSTSGGSLLQLLRARGTKGSPTAALSGNVLGEIRASGHDGSAFGTGAQLYMNAAEDWGTAAHGTRFQFFVAPVGGTSTEEKMRVDGVGMSLAAAGATTRLTIGDGAAEFTEMTAPSAGAANTGRLFCQDNGAGKSQLCVIFNTGAIQVLATQP